MGLFGNATFGEVFVQEIIIDPLDYEGLRVIYDADNKPEKFPSDKELAKAPQNSFIGRATKEKKGGSLKIVWPLFPSHMMFPLKVGEIALTVDIGGQLYWLSRKPAEPIYEDVSLTHGLRSFGGAGGEGSTSEQTDQAEGKEGNKIPGIETFDEQVFHKVQQEILEENRERIHEFLVARGTVANNLPEVVPRFLKRPGDLVLQGSNNTLISLGSDRGYSYEKPHFTNNWSDYAEADVDPTMDPSSSATTTNKPGTGTIDLVTGRGRYAPLPTTSTDQGGTPWRTSCSSINNIFADMDIPELGIEKDKDLESNALNESHHSPIEGDPDFWADTSRIYISSKTWPDMAFSLLDKDEKLEKCQWPPDGEVQSDGSIKYKHPSLPENSRASIVVKSDEIRIISRYIVAKDSKIPDDYGGEDINGSIAIVKEGIRDSDGHSTTDGKGVCGLFLKPDGTAFLDGSKIIIGTGRETDHAAGDHIFLGNGAVEPIVLGTKLKDLLDAFFSDLKSFLSQKYDTHTHPTGVGPSGPPLVTGDDGGCGTASGALDETQSKLVMTR